MDCRNDRAKHRMVRLKKNGGTHTRLEWDNLLSASPFCVECKRPWSDIPPRADPRYKFVWTKGHKIPIYHGGTDDIGNIQAECYKCNFEKNAGKLGSRKTL